MTRLRDSAAPGQVAGRPLAGLRVVEYATFVAGPWAGMSMAQLGADVIRIDPPRGASDYRRWPLAPSGDSLYWNALNKGKRSVTADTRQPAGQELVTALITAPGDDAGVFIDNVVGQAWLSNAKLSARRPDLVHVHVQGHSDGRPAVDYTVNAAVGVPQITGPEPTGEPVNHVLPAWDLLCGATAVAGVLSALRERDRTGVGAYVELALADIALTGVANLGWLADAEFNERDRPRLGNHVYGSFGVDFATADGGRVMVVALTGKQWQALCRVTGTTQVFDALQAALQVDLDDESDRYRLRETIAAVLRPWFEQRPLDQVMTLLDAARVLWGPYRSMTDVARLHAQDEPGSVVAHVDQPGVGPVLTATTPLRWERAAPHVAAAPPLGAHTAEVLADALGLTDAELGRLTATGVVSLPVAVAG